MARGRRHSGLRWAARALAGVGALVLVVLVVYLWPGPFVFTGSVPPGASVPYFRHVFIIMMENHGPNSLLAPSSPDPYIRRLVRTAGYDSDYFGVTHPSLPNYVATIAGTTRHSHSDVPTQRFTVPNLALQLDQAGISWQAVMESMPHAGYTGNWYPDPIPHANPADAPPTALYAKKHDPFMLFPAVVQRDAQKVVPLSTLEAELRQGRVPQLVWITPNLCNDMHGQPDAPGAVCPASNGPKLIADGNGFLQHLIGLITHSHAWGPGSVIFLTWDEGGGPHGATPGAIAAYKAAGPGAPPITASAPWLGTLGGAHTLLIVITLHQRPVTVHLWADHYSILKTIEKSWGLPYLGHAAAGTVPLLTPLLK